MTWSTFDVRESVEPFFSATVFLSEIPCSYKFREANFKYDVFYHTGLYMEGGSALSTWWKGPIHPSYTIPCPGTSSLTIGALPRHAFANIKRTLTFTHVYVTPQRSGPSHTAPNSLAQTTPDHSPAFGSIAHRTELRLSQTV